MVKKKTKHGALPSDDTVLQIVELNEFPKATGVVIVWSPRVAKGLFNTQGSYVFTKINSQICGHVSHRHWHPKSNTYKGSQSSY